MHVLPLYTYVDEINFILEIIRCKTEYWNKNRYLFSASFEKIAYLCLGSFLQILLVYHGQ